MGCPTHDFPYGPHWVHQDPPYYNVLEGTWNTFLVWANRAIGPWFWDANSEELFTNDWNLFYPGHKHVDINDLHELSGTYQDKSVKYNSTSTRWEYLNHKLVNFEPSKTDNPDVTEVSALLDSAVASVSRSRSALTREQQRQSLPGELPVTPSKPLLLNPVLPPAPEKPSEGKAISSKRLPTADPFTANIPIMASATSGFSTKTLGSAPEPFGGTPANAEAFWTNLANYFFLNHDLYSSTSKQIASALTHFKLGTPAGEWAKDRQQTTLANSPLDFGTWDAFKDAFKAHFIPVDGKLLSTQLLHTLKMGNKPISEWYREWSTHANRSGANEETKMYAFRQNIPATLHQKIIGVSPAPITLSHLVELAKDFDQTWRMYNTLRTLSSNSSFNCR
jgi:Retrotransposon gag protein